MSNQVNSAGYGGGIKGSIFAPDRISSKIVVASYLIQIKTKLYFQLNRNLFRMPKEQRQVCGSMSLALFGSLCLEYPLK
jgi:hypothetical protein